MQSLLPIELWDLILCDVVLQDLASLSLVSRYLYNLIRPYLYARIEWKEGKPSLVQQRYPRIHFLLRSILNNPHLAIHIKQAQFQSYVEHIPYRRPSKIPSLWHDSISSGFTIEEFKKVHDLIEQAKITTKNEWVEEFQRGACDVVIALLISLLGQLQSLKLELGMQEEERHFVGDMFRHALSSSCFSTPKSLRFSDLKTVDVFISRDDGDVDEKLLDFDRQVAPLFNLPAIEILKISWTAPDAVVWPGQQPFTYTLSTLILRDCRINEDILDQLLIATPNLRVLDCDLSYDAGMVQSCHCEKLASALERISQTVETLKLSVDFWASTGLDPSDPGDNYSWGIRGYLESLVHFPKLRHLEIPLVILLGWFPNSAPWLWDVLPEQLEIFECQSYLYYFENFKWGHEDILEELIDYLSGEPELSVLNLNIRGTDWPQTTINELRQACSTAGVVCNIFRGSEIL